MYVHIQFTKATPWCDYRANNSSWPPTTIGGALVAPLFRTKLTRCDVNFYGVNMAAFLNTQVLISDGTKGGSFACGVVYVTEVEWHQ